MKNPFTLMTHSSSQGIFTTMIGFVTWPPFDQVTKPIMVVKIPCELLCVIKVKGFFRKQSAKLLGLS